MAAVRYSISVGVGGPAAAAGGGVIIHKSAAAASRKQPGGVSVRVMMSAAENHMISVNTSSTTNSTSSIISTSTPPPPFQIRMIRSQYSSSRAKVFEDGSKGIVCYREENGEITCEGIDEGPRFHHRSSSRFMTTAAISQREAEIIDLLERSLLQIVEGDRST